MRVKVIPHGALCETWPLDFECEADTPAEAIRALESQHDLRRGNGLMKWHVRVAGYDTVPSLNSPLQSNELHLVPDFSGGGGAMKIIIGIVIVVAAIVLAPYTGGTSLYFVGFGLSLVMSGILELLTPSPKTAAPKDPGAESRYLGNSKNTTRIGTRIPIVYGRFPIYGQYISFGVASNPSAEVADATAKRQAAGYAS